MLRAVACTYYPGCHALLPAVLDSASLPAMKMWADGKTQV